MPRVSEFKPYFDNQKQQWAIYIPPAHSPTGKKKREFFKTQALADERSKELRKFRDEGLRVISAANPELIRTAINYDELFRDLYGFSGLDEACSKFMAELDARHQSAKFGTLLDEYQREHGAGWSHSYQNKWNWFLGTVDGLRNQLTPVMTSTFWSQWLDTTCQERDWSNSTYNEVLSMLRSVWKQGVGLDLVQSNPLEGIRRRKTRRKEKRVYTPEQARLIMNCCWEFDRDLVPFFGLALFAGLRPDDNGEIVKLKWEDINFKERWIEVGKSFTNKTGSRRFVDLEDNLYHWLLPWKEQKGSVVTKTNLKDRRRWILRGRYQSPEGTDPKDWNELVPSGSDYRDVTRHSYGSFFDAKYRDRNKLKEMMGHRNFDTYDQYYKNSRTTAEAHEYWSILPPT